MFRYYVQKFLGKIWKEPIVPKNKTFGYSLVRSERKDVNIGEHTQVYVPYFLRGVNLGSYSYIAKNSNITNCSIGKFCSIGPNFCCGLGIHPINGISTAPMFYSMAQQNGMTLCSKAKVDEFEHTIIGNDVFIGANVIVLDGVRIGNGAVIGAGAVVVNDIPDYAVAVGVPARVVKYRFDKYTISRLQNLEWWNWSLDDLKKVELNFWNVSDFIR